MLTVGLEDIRFHAPIGIFPEEKILGNDICVDIHIQIEETGKETYDLSDTIDYQELYFLLKEEVEKETDLLETVAQNCLQHIKEKWPGIKGADLSIRKLNPPVGGQVGASRITLSKRY